MSGLSNKAMSVKGKLEEFILLYEALQKENKLLLSEKLALDKQILEYGSINKILKEEKDTIEEKYRQIKNEKQEIGHLSNNTGTEKEKLLISISTLEEEKRLLKQALHMENEKLSRITHEKERLSDENSSLKLQIEKSEFKDEKPVGGESIANIDDVSIESIKNEIANLRLEAGNLRQENEQLLQRFGLEIKDLTSEIEKLSAEKQELLEKTRIAGENATKIDFQEKLEEITIESELARDELKLSLEQLMVEKDNLLFNLNLLEQEKTELGSKLAAIELERSGLLTEKEQIESELTRAIRENQKHLESIARLESEKGILKGEIERKNYEKNAAGNLFGEDFKKEEPQIANEERQELQNTINRLVEEKKVLKTSINNLEERIKIIKLAKSLSETDEKSFQAKLRINELVREIDKCILLLNR